MTRTLLLDLDGTLVDSVPDLLGSCNRVFTPRGLAPFTVAEVTPMVGDGAGMLVRRALAARGREATQADLDAFLADYLDHVADLSQPYPGAVETLDALAADGWTLAVCTNKPERPARAMLDALGLLRASFAAVGGGDSYPVRKPDPAHLLATLRDAGGDASATVMVGDHHNDLAAASGAGLPSIFAAWGYGPVATGDKATAVARRFPELRSLAAQCLRPDQTGDAPAAPG